MFTAVGRGVALLANSGVGVVLLVEGVARQTVAADKFLWT